MIRSFIMSGLLVLSLLSSVVLAPLAGAAKPDAGGSSELGKFGDAESKSKKLGCSSSFLGFPAWFDHLPRKKGTCDIGLSTNAKQSDISNFIFTIILNVIEIALRLIGFAAVGFIIYGGFKYLTSAGSADRITSGRKIIQNAVIGLVISFFSVAVVNLIASNL